MSQAHRLPASALTSALRRILPELGATNHARVLSLRDLAAEDGNIRLSDALARLFPQRDHDGALAALRSFRKEVNDAANRHALKLRIEVDSKTRSAPDTRTCWFTDETAASDAARHLLQADLATLPAKVIPQMAQSQGRRTLQYFVSYAHVDEEEAKRLLALLKDHFNSAKGYEFIPWIDQNILPGERWHAEIQRAIADCDFGLLLVSPAFLASRYITQDELPHFLSDAVTSGKMFWSVQGMNSYPFALLKWSLSSASRRFASSSSTCA